MCSRMHAVVVGSQPPAHIPSVNKHTCQRAAGPTWDEPQSVFLNPYSHSRTSTNTDLTSLAPLEPPLQEPQPACVLTSCSAITAAISKWPLCPIYTYIDIYVKKIFPLHQRIRQRTICFLPMKSIHLCVMIADIQSTPEYKGYSNIWILFSLCKYSELIFIITVTENCGIHTATRRTARPPWLPSSESTKRTNHYYSVALPKPEQITNLRISKKKSAQKKRLKKRKNVLKAANTLNLHTLRSSATPRDSTPPVWEVLCFACWL